MTPLEQAIQDAARQAIDAVSDGWGDAEDAVARGEITPALRSLVDAVLEEADTAIRSGRQIPTGAGVSQTVATMAMVEEEILHNACLHVRALKSQPAEAKKP